MTRFETSLKSFEVEVELWFVLDPADVGEGVVEVEEAEVGGGATCDVL